MPHKSPLQYSQITAGTSTIMGPICAIQSSRMTAVRNPANGTPVTNRPRPARTVCTNAVTTTPSATARIA